MKIVLRFAVVAAALMAALGASAQRDIVLKLNKHNFHNNDTLLVTAEFKGFGAEGIASPVYADIIAPDDSIVISATMTPIGSDRYSAELAIPSNGFNTHEDILKLSNELSFSSTDILGEGSRILLHLDNTSTLNNTLGEFMKIDPKEIVYLEFQPWNHVSNRNIYPYKDRKVFNESMNVKYVLKALTSKTYHIDNIYTLQITATTDDGETVAGVETIRLPRLDFVTFSEDKRVFNPKTNFLQNIPMDARLQKF